MPLNCRTALTVFCDDVRLEVGNKPSLMGIYSRDMLVPGQMPIILPKLVVVTWVVTPIDNPIKHLEISIICPPDRETIVKVTGDRGAEFDLSEMPPDTQRLIVQQIIPIAPFLVKSDGFIEVEVEADGEKIRSGRLMVRAAPFEVAGENIKFDLPTASPPPS